MIRPRRCLLLLWLLLAGTACLAEPDPWTPPRDRSQVWNIQGTAAFRLEAWADPWPPRPGPTTLRVLLQLPSGESAEVAARFAESPGSTGAYVPMRPAGRAGQTLRFELQQTLAPSHSLIQLQVERPYKGRKGRFPLNWPLAGAPQRHPPATPQPPAATRQPQPLPRATPRPPAARKPPRPLPRVTPRPLPPTATQGPTEESLARALQEMGNELPAAQFRFVRDGFFVVASDLEEAELQSVRSFALQGCCAALLGEFFQKRPAQPVRVYLFKNAASYETWSRKLFKSPPQTPYGYFDGSRNALVMNIATGEGTLVHEMTHALSTADFPECPVWLFEGLGSLFEMPYLSKGSLRGAVNWRLPRLRKAIKEKKTVPLRTLLALGPLEFYSQNTGLNYAESRYLLMFLQEKGLLARYYRQLRQAYPQDRQGIATLEKVWGGSLEGLESEWLRWAQQLH